MYIFILMCQSVNLDWKIAVEKVGCVFCTNSCLAFCTNS